MINTVRAILAARMATWTTHADMLAQHGPADGIK
jgi:hypothetical protein